MKRRILFLSSFAAAAALIFVLGSSHAQPEVLKPIVPGVWFFEGDLKKGHSNNVIIEMKDFLIVVDANFPSGALLTMAAAKKVSSKPVKYVFDTHHHGDHSYGNSLWTMAGATTLAYRGVAEEMKRYEPGRWQATSKARKDVGDCIRTASSPPSRPSTRVLTS